MISLHRGALPVHKQSGNVIPPHRATMQFPSCHFPIMLFFTFHAIASWGYLIPDNLAQNIISHVTISSTLSPLQNSVGFSQLQNLGKLSNLSEFCPVQSSIIVQCLLVGSSIQHRVNPRMGGHLPAEGVILRSNPCIPELRSQRRVQTLRFLTALSQIHSAVADLAEEGIEMSQPSVVLATASYDHTIKFWEAKSARCYRTIQYPESLSETSAFTFFPFLNCIQQVNRLEVTPDKRFLAAAGNPHIRLFDINSSSPQPRRSFDSHTNNVMAVGFQCDGNWMYSGSEDGTVKIWDLRAPGCQREYESRAAVNTVVLHPNQFLAEQGNILNELFRLESIRKDGAALKKVEMALA
ncbi:WD repeat-containing protein wat1 [Capsicum annuum]|nr:WD repeat-containing protein wat1 [Capsicum annuum]